MGYNEVRGKGGQGLKGMAEQECEKHKGLQRCYASKNEHAASLPGKRGINRPKDFMYAVHNISER